MTDFLDKIILGDCRGILRRLPDESVQCVVTSPPYWGLRDYKINPLTWGGDPNCAHEWGTETIKKKQPQRDHGGRDFGQTRGTEPTRKAHALEASLGITCQICGAWRGSLGLEPSLELYLAHLMEIFSEIRRVLKKDGTLWLNMGDGYAGGGFGGWENGETRRGYSGGDTNKGKQYRNCSGLKPKNLLGIPWRVAFALQDAGWLLRSDIIWHKPNCMPSSVKDRPTTAHEYLFLLSKSARYYYDYKAIQEPVAGSAHARGNGVNPKSRNPVPAGWDTSTGKGAHVKLTGRYPRSKQNESFSAVVKDLVLRRNRRSVWTIPTQPFPQAHFAVFPEALVKPCILAGSREGDTVLDPFMGAGTVAVVAARLGRHFIGCEMSPEYIEMAEERLKPHREQTRLFDKVGT